MESWLTFIGVTQPQTQAAIIQGLLSLIGLVLTGLFAVLSWRRTRQADRNRQHDLRREKIADYRAALRAEIASDLRHLEAFDLEQHFSDIEQRYAADAAYSVVVPYLATNIVFRSITAELHILPHSVIAAVVDYERLRETIGSFVGDLRDRRFTRLSTARQLEMYRGYLSMRLRLASLARKAAAALDEADDAQ